LPFWAKYLPCQWFFNFIFDEFFDLTGSAQSAFLPAFRLMKQVLSMFPNVSHLIVEGHYPRWNTKKENIEPSLVCAAWPTLSSTLRRLEIQACLMGMQELLPPFPSAFVSLEDLTLGFGHPDPSHRALILADPAKLTHEFKAASSFLHVVALQLRSLTFSFTWRDKEQTLILAPFFFNSLPVFPRLHTFTYFIPALCHGIANVTDQPIWHPAASLLKMNADSIQHLHIQTCVFDEVKQMISPVHSQNPLSLPQLTSLSLLYPDGNDSPEKVPPPMPETPPLSIALAYIHSSYKTLTFLSLCHGILYLEELDVVLRNTFTNLQTLEIRIHTLKATLFDLLNDKTPSLERLKIHFSWLGVGGKDFDSTRTIPSQYTHVISEEVRGASPPPPHSICAVENSNISCHTGSSLFPFHHGHPALSLLSNPHSLH
jgi:hypothetical protein